MESIKVLGYRLILTYKINFLHEILTCCLLFLQLTNPSKLFLVNTTNICRKESCILYITARCRALRKENMSKYKLHVVS